MKGYFKAGDCIEISGKITGIVAEANEDTFWMNRLIDDEYGGLFRNPDASAYSNEASHYEGKYWIKVVKAPKEYKTFTVKPLTF